MHSQSLLQINILKNLWRHFWQHLWQLKEINAWKAGGFIWSSLIYNTSSRHEWHECDTSATRMRHECDTNATQARHECYTNDTSVTRVRHEWTILILIATRVKTYFYTLIFTIWQRSLVFDKNHFMWKYQHSFSQELLKAS